MLENLTQINDHNILRSSDSSLSIKKSGDVNPEKETECSLAGDSVKLLTLGLHVGLHILII